MEESEGKGGGFPTSRHSAELPRYEQRVTQHMTKLKTSRWQCFAYTTNVEPWSRVSVTRLEGHRWLMMTRLPHYIHGIMRRTFRHRFSSKFFTPGNSCQQK